VLPQRSAEASKPAHQGIKFSMWRGFSNKHNFAHHNSHLGDSHDMVGHFFHDSGQFNVACGTVCCTCARRHPQPTKNPGHVGGSTHGFVDDGIGKSGSLGAPAEPPAWP